MGNQARVTSSDALESFRASLIIFMAKANRSVNDVSDEVRRTRLWLQHDQRVHWESEARKRAKVLDQAQQELMSARLIKNNQTALMVRQAAVNKAKRSLTESQDKLRRVKLWNQNFDSAADPIVKRLEGMRQFLDVDMPKAIAYLVAVLRTLAAYSEGPPPSSSPGVPAVQDETPPEDAADSSSQQSTQLSPNE